MEYRLMEKSIEVDNGDIIEIDILYKKLYFKVHNVSIKWQDINGWECDRDGNEYGVQWDFGYFLLYALQEELNFNMKVKDET